MWSLGLSLPTSDGVTVCRRSSWITNVTVVPPNPRSSDRSPLCQSESPATAAAHPRLLTSLIDFRSFLRSSVRSVLIIHLQRFEVTPCFTVEKTHKAISLSTELLLHTNQSSEKVTMVTMSAVISLCVGDQTVK